ncbi:acetyl-CoA acetyltransferase [Terricaulis sp.]|uniref:acetyl-CoA acetyltransferase n=1 Tax=Terricaulis sp. TaxID=2768686 RepID=UPI003784A438
MARDETRIPVIVGVGQINDRPADGAEGLDSLQLMHAALERADEDAGGGWLGGLDSLSTVAQLSFPALGDCSKPLAELIGASPRLCEQTRYPMGDSPVALLNDAANRIAAGEIASAAIAGGEALRTAAQRAAGENAVRASAARAVQAARPGRERYGVVAPTDIYPLYENACRAAWGQTLAQAQAESAELWAGMSRVAAESDGAWLRKAVTPAEILAVSADNRPIAFPYTKLMVANSSVNQGAGFIVASLAKARQMGARETQLIYVGHGAAAREPGDVLARDRIDRSLSLETSLRAALARNRLTSADLDYAELYSCFPCVPKMARRAIGWPLENDITVFGGLTFGGGPVGNYMSHAIAAMTDSLRKRGRTGLLFGNGGFATTSHAIIVSRDPALAINAPHDPSVQAEADAQRGPAPALLEDYEGPAAIETYTVFYARDGAAKNGVIVARTPSGARFLAYVPADDASMIAFLTDGAREPVGASGKAVRGSDGLIVWESA